MNCMKAGNMLNMEHTYGVFTLLLTQLVQNVNVFQASCSKRHLESFQRVCFHDDSCSNKGAHEISRPQCGHLLSQVCE